jgi:hypothetical protein
MSTRDTEQRTSDSIQRSIREGRREKKKEIARDLASAVSDLSHVFDNDTDDVHQANLTKWLRRPTNYVLGQQVLNELSEAMTAAVESSRGDSTVDPRVGLEDTLLTLSDTLQHLQDHKGNELLWPL